MASERIIGGECPSCGSNKTEIVLQTKRKPVGDISGTSYRAYGVCHSCGFQDAPIRAEDAELAVDIASRSFSKVYIDDSPEHERDAATIDMDGMAEGFGVMLEEIADEFSMVLSEICNMHTSCHDCPIIPSNGSIAMQSRFGLGCYAKTKREVVDAITEYYRSA